MNAAVSHVKDRDNTVYNILSENQFYIFLDHDNGFVKKWSLKLKHKGILLIWVLCIIPQLQG